MPKKRLTLDDYLEKIGKQPIGYFPKELFSNRTFVLALLKEEFSEEKGRNYYTNKIFLRFPDEFKTDPEILIPYLRQIKRRFSPEENPRYNMENYLKIILTEYGFKISDELRSALIEEGIIGGNDVGKDKFISKKKSETPQERSARIKETLDSTPDDELWNVAQQFGKKEPYEIGLDLEYLLELIRRDERFFRWLKPLDRMNPRIQKRAIANNSKVEGEIRSITEQSRRTSSPKSSTTPKTSRIRPQTSNPSTKPTHKPKVDKTTAQELKCDVDFVLKFINALQSKASFCKENGKTESEFDTIVNRVGKVFPNLKEAVTFITLEYQSAFQLKCKEIADDLCKGRMTIQYFAVNNYSSIKVDKILVFAREEQKAVIRRLILEAMQSNTLSMMDYIRLFTHKISVNELKSEVRKFFQAIPGVTDEKSSESEAGEVSARKSDNGVIISKKLINEARRNVYGHIYQHKQGYDRQNMLNAIYTQTSSINVTIETIVLAEKLVKCRGGFVSAASVNKAIFEIAAGEISSSEIENMYELWSRKERCLEFIITIDEQRVGLRVSEILAGEFEYGGK